MDNGSNSFKSEGNFASPPCMAAEVDPGYFDPLALDPNKRATWPGGARLHASDFAKRVGRFPRPRGQKQV